MRKHHMTQNQSHLLSLQFSCFFLLENSLPDTITLKSKINSWDYILTIKSIYNKKDKISMKKDDFYRILDE